MEIQYVWETTRKLVTSNQFSYLLISFLQNQENLLNFQLCTDSRTHRRLCRDDCKSCPKISINKNNFVRIQLRWKLSNKILRRKSSKVPSKHYCWHISVSRIRCQHVRYIIFYALHLNFLLSLPQRAIFSRIGNQDVRSLSLIWILRFFIALQGHFCGITKLILVCLE